MLTEDYIMRMINLALAVLVKVASFKQAGRYEEAIQHIDQALEILFGMRADLVRRLDDNSLLDAMTVQETLDTDRLLVVAELFKEEGDILLRQDRKGESTLSYQRALNFYLEVVLSNDPENLPELEDKIEQLLLQLNGYDLPSETLYALFVFYAQLGKFDAAAKKLKQIADSTKPSADLSQEIIDFYQDLLLKPDEELHKGGLTREEIKSRLKSL
jgi:tetratricopeptide (TPR) repeat protein